MLEEQQWSGAVAQLVAHLHGMQGVRGSSPLSSTNNPLEHREVAWFQRIFVLRRLSVLALSSWPLKGATSIGDVG